MKSIYIYTALLLITFSAKAQNPAPSDNMKRILFIGAKAHLGNGEVIEQSAIGIANGKITFVMSSQGYKADRNSFDTIINVDGKDIYPGFIAMNTTLGLREIELVRSTTDNAEVGNLNPSVRAISAYNTDSKVIPTVRDNGVLMAQIVPSGGLISGSSSVVQLDAWNWEDAAVKTDEGIVMNWPSMRIYKSDKTSEEEQRETMEKQLQEIEKLFSDAQAYAVSKSVPVINQHLESMRGLFNGSKKLYIHCNSVKEIISAVQFCKQKKIQMVLVEGQDSWRAADLLKANNIPVIIVRTHVLPMRDDEDIDLPYKLPYLLYKAGVKFCITDDGYWQQRNVGFEAGTAVGYELPYEEAVRSITSAPAEILGIGSTCGQLKDGMDATLFISSGDALDMKSCKVEMAFIQGREINSDNIQKQLYRKYMKKYHLE
ncbi:MAG: amidohydrolase [Bacteroidota bacterium]